jgi:hypothetical protein
MLRMLALTSLVAAAAWAQGSGGRDAGGGPNAVLFVRWQRSSESGAIYRAAWRALEPHFGVLSRRRLTDFNGDARRARAFLAEHAGAALVVAFGARAAEVTRAALPGKPVLEVGCGERAAVRGRVDREQLARILRLFHPRARTIAIFGDQEEALGGFRTKRCERAEDAAGCDLAWIPEGSSADARSLRPALDRLQVPLLVTAGDRHPGEAALEVRPDPVGLGYRVASLVLRRLRDKRVFTPGGVKRMRVSVDLRAARAASHDVPLGVLARADVVRRAP